MQDEATDILDPDQPVTLSTGQTVVVREMTWKQSKRFLGALASRTAAFTTLAPDNRVSVDTEKLIQVVATELGETLILAATDLEAAAIDDLRLRDMVNLIDRTVALNLRPEMIEAGAKIAGRFKSLMGK